MLLVFFFWLSVMVALFCCPLFRCIFCCGAGLWRRGWGDEVAHAHYLIWSGESGWTEVNLKFWEIKMNLKQNSDRNTKANCVVDSLSVFKNQSLENLIFLLWILFFFVIIHTVFVSGVCGSVGLLVKHLLSLSLPPFPVWIYNLFINIIIITIFFLLPVYSWDTNRFCCVDR